MAAAPSIDQLKERANTIRKLIVRITTEAGSGHPSSSLSATEVVTALYFGGFMNYDPNQPKDPKRDRFILSKGTPARCCTRRWPRRATSRPKRS